MSSRQRQTDERPWRRDGGDVGGNGGVMGIKAMDKDRVPRNPLFHFVDVVLRGVDEVFLQDNPLTSLIGTARRLSTVTVRPGVASAAGCGMVILAKEVRGRGDLRGSATLSASAHTPWVDR